MEVRCTSPNFSRDLHDLSNVNGINGHQGLRMQWSQVSGAHIETRARRFEDDSQFLDQRKCVSVAD
ncbi:hypothetical protein Scep_013196 [Stephania cephalantha]|uniref:Uncharacterized protein n=1 Tax=Stephania cephalantha TaxID=152367 RepID=A0AAP0JIE0_9MAGN